MSRRERGLLVPLVLLSGAFVWMMVATQGVAFVDTYVLLQGTHIAALCLHHEILRRCGEEVGQYPLLQYLPTLVFHELGSTSSQALKGLVILNGVGLFAICGLVAFAVNRLAGGAAAAVASAIVLSTPLLWYGHAAFGEELAALVITGYAVALLIRARLPVTAALLCLAGMTKETAVPYLLGFTVLTWLLPGRRPTRREVASLVASALVAVAANVAFNEFRYGQLTNPFYMRSEYVVGPARTAAQFLALLVSPTAGMLFMCTALLVVVGGAIGLGWREHSWRSPGVWIGALFAALLLPFAAWYGPFGGLDWGPRFLVPWLALLLILCFAAYPRAFRQAIDEMLRERRSAALLAATLIVVGLPQMIVTADSSRFVRSSPGSSLNYNELIARPFIPDRACPTLPQIERNRRYYLHCSRHQTWDKGVIPAETFSRLSEPRVLIFAVLWAAAVAGLIALARRDLIRRGERAAIGG